MVKVALYAIPVCHALPAAADRSRIPFFFPL
jgi:hypothetical protein